MIDRDALADIAAETIHAVDPGHTGRPVEDYADIAGELADRVQAAVSQLELVEWLSTVLPGEGATREADVQTIAGAVFADLHEVSSSPLIEQIDPEAATPSA
ncbi:hypothetical protein [Labedella endophytica]|uniref:Uncharacterized protein n=1 Tax=Labedella endophytica TaxID=1523160 RepID=A0A3S1CSC3_9MICO|nr:hypothetical protein [Labedella endophytica]RUR01265.1 hypothetical protein ELQ94_07065 [Labedella endophytica]